MMLKILLYAYTQPVFSGRKIEKLLNDSIRMMWLSQNQTPFIKPLTVLESTLLNLSFEFFIFKFRFRLHHTIECFL